MATINVPHLFTSLLAIAGEVFVFGRLCLLLGPITAIWKNGCSYRYETIRLDGQLLWDHTIKLIRWQHPALCAGALDEVCSACTACSIVL